MQMLRNLIEALKLLNTAKPSASSAGLELLLAARGSEDGSGAPQLPPPKLAVAHYVRREADAAWDCMQVCTTPCTLRLGFESASLTGVWTNVCPLHKQEQPRFLSE